MAYTCTYIEVQQLLKDMFQCRPGFNFSKYNATPHISHIFMAFHQQQNIDVISWSLESWKFEFHELPINDLLYQIYVVETNI